MRQRVHSLGLVQSAPQFIAMLLTTTGIAAELDGDGDGDGEQMNRRPHPALSASEHLEHEWAHGNDRFSLRLRRQPAQRREQTLLRPTSDEAAADEAEARGLWGTTSSV